MQLLKALILVAPLALSTAALAQPAHISDAEYIAAARCQGLMSSSALGRQDTRAVDAMMKAQSGARIDAVFDRADDARADAVRAASHAGAYGKAALIAERDGVCRSLTGTTTQSASAAAPGSTGAN